jgi:hypothetical protein
MTDASGKFYSEEQERDEHGRWTAGGSGAGSAAEKAQSPSEHTEALKHHKAAEDFHRAQADKHGKNGPAYAAHRAAQGAHAHASNEHIAAMLGGGGDDRATAAETHAASKAAHESSAKALAVSSRGGLGGVKVGGIRGITRSMTHGAAAQPDQMQLAFAAQLDISGDEPQTRVVDGVEYVVGKPIHIFPKGEWTAVDGRQVVFTAEDARAMCEDLSTRHSDLALTFDHETDKARGSEAAGWMPQDKFVFRSDGLWNTEPLWRKDVYEKLLKTGAFRYLSGDALGIGSARDGDAFHPRRLLAASLVPKPGFVRGLKGIQLSAEDKEKFMAKMTRKELCQQMGVDENSTVEDLREAFNKFLDEEAGEAEHEKMGAKHCANCDDPNCPGCEGTEKKLGAVPPEFEKHKKTADDEGGADEANETADEEDKEEKMGAKTETPAAGADEKLVAEKFTAALNDVTDKAITSAKEEATRQIEARFASEARAKEVDSLLAEAETDGRITAANREVFKETFGVNFEHGKKLLAGLPKPAVAPGEALSSRNAFITGGGSAPKSREDLIKIFDNPDRDPRKYAEQSKILTQVARFSAHEGVDPEMAWAAVLTGKNEKLEQEIFAAGDLTAEKYNGEKIGQFRASQRQIPVDPEMVDFIRKRVSSGKIPDGIISTEMQKFTTLADFQPSAKTTLPMALGYFQSEFVGDEALPVFVGGADEKAAWPEFAFEKFAAIAQAAGLLASPTRTSLNVTWHTVTLEKYPVQVDIDRRARAASVTLPRGIDTIALENVKSQVGVTKEVAQASFLTTNGNYFDSTYYPTLSQPWSNAGTPAAYVGVPMDDITKGMAHIRLGVRAWPDLLLLSPNAALSLRKNQQIIDTVRYTGTMERPGTMVPNSTLAAIFAGLLNLTIVVGEAGSSSLPSGSPVTDVWGNDAWLLVTGKGKIEAPRFGMTVSAAGSPRVRAFPQEGLGADGADSIVYTDAWQLVSVAKKAGYRMIGASAAL